MTNKTHRFLALTSIVACAWISRPGRANTIFTDTFDRPATTVTQHQLGGPFTDDPADIGTGWVAVRSGNCNWGGIPDAHLVSGGKVEIARFGGGDWAKGAVTVTHKLAATEKAQGIQADVWFMPWYWHTYHKPGLQSNSYLVLRMQDTASGAWVLTRINADKNAEKGDKPWLFAETIVSTDGKWPAEKNQIARYAIGYAGAPKWPTHEEGDSWNTLDTDPDLGWITCRQSIEMHDGHLAVHYTITKGTSCIADGWIPWNGPKQPEFDSVGFGMDFDVNTIAKDDAYNAYGKALLDNFQAFAVDK
ncbi:MAG TPA: hypothetical protein VHV83_03430 [Armatimonadota bacterium]|nr:hypothetical protein [Armatimonadota bacterium]